MIADACLQDGGLKRLSVAQYILMRRSWPIDRVVYDNPQYPSILRWTRGTMGLKLAHAGMDSIAALNRKGMLETVEQTAARYGQTYLYPFDDPFRDKANHHPMLSEIGEIVSASVILDSAQSKRDVLRVFEHRVKYNRDHAKIIKSRAGKSGALLHVKSMLSKGPLHGKARKIIADVWEEDGSPKRELTSIELAEIAGSLIQSDRNRRG